MAEATILLPTRAGNLALLRPLDDASSVVLGSQNDNKAHALRIVRDAEFDPCSLLLHFDEGQVLLCVENDYTLPRAVTQKARNHPSVSILSGDHVVEHTNIVTLLMRPCHADAADIEPLPDIGTELLQQAGTQIAQDGGDLVLLGLGGQERGRVSIGTVTQGAVARRVKKATPARMVLLAMMVLLAKMVHPAQRATQVRTALPARMVHLARKATRENLSLTARPVQRVSLLELLGECRDGEVLCNADLGKR